MVTKASYLKAVLTIAKYKKQVKDAKELAKKNKPVRVTRAEKNLAKAKELYPIGTRFYSIYGADDVVTKCDGSTCTYWLTEFNDVMVNGRYEPRMIFDGSRWSTKIKQ